jgi:hypothetical protein
MFVNLQSDYRAAWMSLDSYELLGDDICKDMQTGLEAAGDDDAIASYGFGCFGL